MPPTCTMITPTVWGVSAASTVSAVRARLDSAISANRGVAPAWRTAAEVAKKVLAGTTTSRPATPSTRRVISRALVPLLTATACRDW